MSYQPVLLLIARLLNYVPREGLERVSQVDLDPASSSLDQGQATLN